VQRFSALCLVSAVLLTSAVGCKRNKDTVAPEEDTWVPDETREPEAATPDPAPGLTEDERNAMAKDLYIEAEGKAKDGDWAGALPLYEQAYQLVPGKHGFALKVGTAAEKSGDCAKAITYYEHFVQYAEADKYKDDISATKKALAALKKKGC
jgi:tetratricopeptide (TPR) repeat protein